MLSVLSLLNLDHHFLWQRRWRCWGPVCHGTDDQVNQTEKGYGYRCKNEEQDQDQNDLAPAEIQDGHTVKARVHVDAKSEVSRNSTRTVTQAAAGVNVPELRSGNPTTQGLQGIPGRATKSRGESGVLVQFIAWPGMEQ